MKTSGNAADNHSSEHDATTNPTTMFGNYFSLGEQVINYVPQTFGEAVQPDVLQTLTNSLCSVMNGSVKQACANGDFDFNMIHMEVEGEENIPTGRS